MGEGPAQIFLSHFSQTIYIQKSKRAATFFFVKPSLGGPGGPGGPSCQYGPGGQGCPGVQGGPGGPGGQVGLGSLGCQ